MLKKLIVVLLLVFSGVVSAPAPAQAGALCETGHICGDFYHARDAGYDAAIPVTCNLSNPWGNYQRVAEYRSSTCHDADGFYVGKGKNVTCLFSDTWIKFTRQGWVKFNDSQNVRCVHGLD